MADYATLLRDHVTLTCRSVDRIFLQADGPKLPSVGGVCQFLYWQKGFGIPSWAAFPAPSSAASALDSTALRVALDARGRAVGVDLISGERVEARRAIVSNLTVWDTYGKLLGADRTPPDVRAQLKALRGWGAYQIFLSLEEEAAQRLPTEHVIALGEYLFMALGTFVVGRIEPADGGVVVVCACVSYTIANIAMR